MNLRQFRIKDESFIVEDSELVSAVTEVVKALQRQNITFAKGYPTGWKGALVYSTMFKCPVHMYDMHKFIGGVEKKVAHQLSSWEEEGRKLIKGDISIQFIETSCIDQFKVLFQKHIK